MNQLTATEVRDSQENFDLTAMSKAVDAEQQDAIDEILERWPFLDEWIEMNNQITGLPVQ